MTLNSFTDRDLLKALTINFRHLHQERMCKRAAIPFAKEKVEQLQLDNDYIMREIMHRIPSTHTWDIEQIKQRLTALAKGVAPGNLYKHNMVGPIRLQVIDEYEFNGPLWSCRLHLGGKYICRVIVKQHTILEHFTRIDQVSRIQNPKR